MTSSEVSASAEGLEAKLQGLDVGKETGFLDLPGGRSQVKPSSFTVTNMSSS